MSMRTKPWVGGLIVPTLIILLGSCASPQPSAGVALKPGLAWQDVARVAGKPTVKFSYINQGRKYDLVQLGKSPSPVVFENGRLFKVLPPDGINAFDRKIEEHLKTVQLPFENGTSELHAWVLTKSAERPKDASHASFKAGDLAEAAATGIILAPIAPFLLAGGVNSAAEFAMTGRDRTKAQSTNEALLAADSSFTTFLSRFGGFDFHTARGTYQIREYLATDGAFFTGRDYFYEVGFRNHRPVWVTYKNDAVRSHAVKYWNTHH